MRGNKITAGQWKRKANTGFVRGKRTSVRSRRRAYMRALQENLAAQLRQGAKDITEGPQVTEI